MTVQSHKYQDNQTISSIVIHYSETVEKIIRFIKLSLLIIHRHTDHCRKIHTTTKQPPTDYLTRNKDDVT